MLRVVQVGEQCKPKRTAFRTGLQLIGDRASPQDELRGGKLFLLKLFHGCFSIVMRGKHAYLQETCSDEAKYSRAVNGLCLLQEAVAGVAAPAARRSEVQDLAARAGRATTCTRPPGELSAAARALVADPLAPRSAAALAELRDPARRPAEPYSPMSADIAAFQPGEPCPFPLPPFLTCLRTARRGAAAGPSGATTGAAWPAWLLPPRPIR